MNRLYENLVKPQYWDRLFAWPDYETVIYTPANLPRVPKDQSMVRGRLELWQEHIPVMMRIHRTDNGRIEAVENSPYLPAWGGNTHHIPDPRSAMRVALSIGWIIASLPTPEGDSELRYWLYINPQGRYPTSLSLRFQKLFRHRKEDYMKYRVAMTGGVSNLRPIRGEKVTPDELEALKAVDQLGLTPTNQLPSIQSVLAEAPSDATVEEWARGASFLTIPTAEGDRRYHTLTNRNGTVIFAESNRVYLRWEDKTGDWVDRKDIQFEREIRPAEPMEATATRALR